MKILTTLP